MTQTNDISNIREIFRPSIHNYLYLVPSKVSTFDVYLQLISIWVLYVLCKFANSVRMHQQYFKSPDYNYDFKQKQPTLFLKFKSKVFKFVNVWVIYRKKFKMGV